jgi:hypothetical protein
MSDKPENLFDGDLAGARERLRNLTEIACAVLDASKLNLASYHLCAYIDNTLNSEKLTKGMIGDLERERLRDLWARFREDQWGKA